jgi:hypothetical protein
MLRVGYSSRNQHWMRGDNCTRYFLRNALPKNAPRVFEELKYRGLELTSILTLPQNYYFQC